VTRGDGPDAPKNQPPNASPSLVSNVTGSTPVRPISPGVGTPPAGKYMSRRCIVQMSARTTATMTTTYPAAMIIERLILRAPCFELFQAEPLLDARPSPASARGRRLNLLHRSLELTMRSGWRTAGPPRQRRRRHSRDRCFWRRARVGLPGDRTRDRVNSSELRTTSQSPICGARVSAALRLLEARLSARGARRQR